jgi:hypothetical protein
MESLSKVMTDWCVGLPRHAVESVLTAAERSALAGRLRIIVLHAAHNQPLT